MKSSVAKIHECPLRIQLRLDKTPPRVPDDFVGNMLTRKNRRRAELNDRVLASSVVNREDQKKKHMRNQKVGKVAKSVSSDSSDPPIPIMQSGLSDGEEERHPPIPTPPVYETVVREAPPPMSSSIGVTAHGAKHQAPNLISRTPSRRVSVVSAGTSHPIHHSTGAHSPPHVLSVPFRGPLQEPQQAHVPIPTTWNAVE